MKNKYALLIHESKRETIPQERSFLEKMSGSGAREKSEWTKKTFIFDREHKKTYPIEWWEFIDGEEGNAVSALGDMRMLYDTQEEALEDWYDHRANFAGNQGPSRIVVWTIETLAWKLTRTDAEDPKVLVRKIRDRETESLIKMINKERAKNDKEEKG